MTNKSILEGWEEVFNRAKITGSIHDRHLICLSPKEDHLDDNEYVFLDEWIKAKLQAQREKDKERLLEGMEKEVLKYDISGRHYLIEQLNKVINKIYE